MAEEREDAGPGVAGSRIRGASRAPARARSATWFASAGDGVLTPVNEAAAHLWESITASQRAGLTACAERAKGDTAGEFQVVAMPDEVGERTFELGLASMAAAEGDLFLCREITHERNLQSALVDSRRRYKDLVEVSSDFAWETDAKGEFVFVSPRGALGYPAEELVGRPAKSFVVGELDESMPSPFDAREPLDRVETWFRRAGGDVACLQASALPLLADDGAWRGARGVCRDVTQERERDSDLARARNRERLHAYILHAIRDEVDPDKMLDAAAATVGRALSAAACHVYRFAGMPRLVPAAEYGVEVKPVAFGPALERAESSKSPVEAHAGAWRVLVLATRYHREATGAVCLARPADGPAWTEEDRRVLADAVEQVAIAIEQVAHHESLRRLSRTDPLTGLLNRRAFFEEMEKRLAGAKRRRRTGALVYLDLDNFKQVNDKLGHQEGDAVLRRVAEMLAANARTGDLVVRLGGDEFALWLDGSDAAGAEAKARELLKKAGALEKYSAGPDHPLGLSIGVAPFRPGGGGRLEELIARADDAMYRVKRAGKGGYRVAAADAEAAA